ncbi:GNAT family N-acetyltransferase [Dyadobacter sp. CY343]|nr:GNAT family N-acetyltransferase [Dyadobacter sp. CY343]
MLQCRTTKGYYISISENELQVLLTQFPNDFLTFTATKNNEIIALVIVVRVNEKILYTFLSSYRPDFAAFSPIVFLTQKIYEYGQRNGFEILDLGTSLDHLGAHKESLSRFKRNLGAETCEKVTYHLAF